MHLCFIAVQERLIAERSGKSFINNIHSGGGGMTGLISRIGSMMSLSGRPAFGSQPQVPGLPAPALGKNSRCACMPCMAVAHSHRVTFLHFGYGGDYKAVNMFIAE